MSIKTTLIVSTYNWPDALYLVLNSVLKQSVLPDEIIIADDGSTNDTKKLIHSFKSKCNTLLIHLWQEDKGFRKSLILNKAILKASGDYIIQIDGDIILHKHFVKDHIRNRNINTFLFGNRVTIKALKSEQLLKSKQFRIHYFSNGISKRNRLIRLPFFSHFSKAKNENSGKLRGCNLSYWKKDAMAINGYNEGFEGWGYEDYEFAQRLVNYGVFGKRVKHAAIQFHLFHNEAPKGSTTIGDQLLTETVKNRVCFIDNGIIKK